MANQVPVNEVKKLMVEIVILASELGGRQEGNAGVFPKDWLECREGVVFP